MLRAGDVDLRPGVGGGTAHTGGLQFGVAVPALSIDCWARQQETDQDDRCEAQQIDSPADSVLEIRTRGALSTKPIRNVERNSLSGGVTSTPSSFNT